MKAALLPLGGLVASCLLAISATGAEKPTVAVEGTLTIVRYTGETKESIQNTSEGSFHFVQAPEKYYLRMHSPMPEVDFGVYVVSDHSTVYQSETIKPRDVNLRDKRGPWTNRAFGQFTSGPMPNAFARWGAAQGLVLAYLLTLRGDQFADNDPLPPALVPEVITVRAGEFRRHLRTQLNKGTDGQIRRASFWGTKDPDYRGKLESSEQCILIGELQILAAEKGVPTKATFLLNRFATDVKSAVITKFVEATYDARLAEPNTEVVGSNAYLRVESVAVADYRFQGDGPFKYSLSEGDAVPFNDPSGRKSYDKIAGEFSRLREAGKSSGTKRTIVMTACVAVLCALAAVLTIRSGKNKTVPT